MLLLLLLCSPNLFADSYNTWDIEVNKTLMYDNSEVHITGDINDTTINMSELWLEMDYSSLQLIMGRKNLKQGPGHFSQLILSEQGPPLEVIMTKNKYKYFSARQLIAFPGAGTDKQLFVHRLENSSFIPNLEIGISEAMMASEKIHPAYYIPLPYWPYYLTSKLLGLYSEYNSHEDKYIGIDFTYNFENNAKVYGELLVDEYPMYSWANNPDKRAHILGFYYPFNRELKFRLEYSNVFNGVYRHRYEENNYTSSGDCIGHWLGEDGEVVDIEIEKEIDKSQSLTTGVRYLRKGTGEMEGSTADNPIEEGLLNTVTEREKLLCLGYNRHINSDTEVKINLETGQLWKKGRGEEDVVNIDYTIKLSL